MSRKCPFLAVLSLLIILCLSACTSLEKGNRAQAIQHVQQAREFHGSGETDKAFASIENALDTDPGFAAAHVLLGKMYMQEERYQKALGAFEDAVALSPSNAVALYYTGYINECLNRYYAAYDYYHKAISLDSRLLDPAHNPLIVRSRHRIRLYLDMYQMLLGRIFSPINRTYDLADRELHIVLP